MKLLLRNLILAAAVLPLCASVGSADDIVDTAVKAKKFNTLAAALKAAGLIETLKSKGPFTVFAPTDEAFAALPKGTVETLLKPENREKLVGVLTYHVVPGKVTAGQVVKLSGAQTVNGQRIDIKVAGGKVKVDGATVTATDIECSNGVIHIIDRVILPENKKIPAVADNAKTFKTLLAAAKAAGLVSALNSDGPLTVFAPTDDAFAKLPKGTVESLLKPEAKAQLANILKYHVVSGRVYSDDVVKLTSAKTLLGEKVSISVKNGVKVNKASVIATDIDAANGVIHVIDSVLLPPMKASHAMAKLEQTVSKGADLYNSGHHKACSSLYRKAMSDLMSEQISGLNEHDYRMMSSTLKAAADEHSQTEKAWILRRAIDRMYHTLSRSAQH